jgi:hypothetical protein
LFVCKCVLYCTAATGCQPNFSYCIIHHIISYIISYRIIYHIISSYHIISYHIIPYYITSHHITSHHITSYHIISYHIISYHIIYTSTEIVIITDNLFVTDYILSSSYKYQATHM